MPTGCGTECELLKVPFVQGTAQILMTSHLSQLISPQASQILELLNNLFELCASEFPGREDSYIQMESRTPCPGFTEAAHVTECAVPVNFHQGIRMTQFSPALLLSSIAYRNW